MADSQRDPRDRITNRANVHAAFEPVCGDSPSYETHTASPLFTAATSTDSVDGIDFDKYEIEGIDLEEYGDAGVILPELPSAKD